MAEKASLEGERQKQKEEHSRPTGRSREKNPHFKLLKSETPLSFCNGFSPLFSFLLNSR